MAFGKKRTTGSSPISAAASYEAKTPIEYEYLSYGERDDISKQNVFFDVARFGTRQSAVAFSARAVAPVIESPVVFSASVANANSPILSDDYATIVGTIGNDVINGTAGDDNIQGLGGNDIINGLEGNDVIDGGAGNDVINGLVGNDVIDGGTGDDRINGGEGNDTLIGGTGTDTAIFDAALVRGESRVRTLALDRNLTGFEFVDFAPGLGVVVGSPNIPEAAISYIVTLSNEIVDTGSSISISAISLRRGVTVSLGADNMRGGVGINADTFVDETIMVDGSAITGARNLFISGGQGNDAIRGGSGNDTFTGFGGSDHFDGGSGNDTVRYTLGGLPFTGNINANLVTGIVEKGGSIDTLLSIENIEGGSFDDVLIGDTQNNRLSGGRGNDNIDGGSGNDVLSGDEGVDIINGGDGDDIIDAGFFDNDLDLIFGGEGNDVLAINLNDSADGGNGIDTLRITSNPFSNVNGIIIDLSEFWRGGVGLIGSGRVSNFELIDAFVLNGTSGNDFILLGTGSEGASVFGMPLRVEGGGGNDQIIGGNDKNFLAGNDGDDVVIGLDGDDALGGNNGNDRLEGGNGNDSLFGGAGSDILIGGEGSDIYRYSDIDSPIDDQIIEISSDSGIDTILLRTSVQRTDEFFFGFNFENIESIALDGDPSFSQFTLSSNFQLLNLKNVSVHNAVIIATDLTVGLNISTTIQFSADRRIFLGSGDDSFYVTSTDVISRSATIELSGGLGNDVLIYDGILQVGAVRTALLGPEIPPPTAGAGGGFVGFSAFETIRLATGVAAVSVAGAADIAGGGKSYTVNLVDANIDIGATLLIDASALRDDVRVNLGADGEIGGTGVNSDVLSGESATINASNITGARAIEVIGGRANDNIIGGSGDDRLTGGLGADPLNGGSGSDTILFSDSQSRIFVNLNTGVGSGGTAQGDTYSNIENVIGSSFDDTIIGNTIANKLIGGAGDDTLNGLDGEDELDGGDGIDTLAGGAGNDVIFGGAGDDTLSGGAGNDVIYGDTPTVASVIAGARASLGASDYAILYQGPSYNLNAIAASNHDLLIIPAARTISFPQAGRNLESLWTAGELDQIKATGKKLIGYLDLAKINDFQVDWQASWTTNGRANGALTANAPLWLGAYETAAGVENTTIRAVNFADPAWRQFLFNRVDTLIGQGFNGVFFDDVGEYFARNVGSIPNIAQAARDMRDLIIDVAAHARQTVAALRGTAAADAFSIIINGDPFLITNSTADGSSPNSARNALFYDTVDALLGENYFSIANNGLAVTKAISEFTSRGITLLSADTGGASNLTPQQQQDIIRAAVSAGFLPFTTPSPLYNTLGARLNPATIPAPIAGNDLLDGGTGADRLLGGVGNDTYVIDDLGDVVTEFAGEGVDIVQSSVDHTLGTNFENLILTGTANLNGNGNAANNIINGNAGANAIDGRGGNDTLAGFGGDDVYVVDSAGDIIIETVGGGIDIVFAETSYVLSGAAEVEVFSARSQADTLAINLTGNNFDQLIRGNAGANAIDGRGGNDTLFGFGGNDTFTFLNGFGNDRIGDFDANPDAGQDLLDLRAFGISSASFDNQVTIAQQGLNTLISFGGGSILLAGVNAADITQSDFIL
jgi:trimeric autotransporter adhesin